MSRPQRYFPWKVAREFFLGHWMFVLVTLLLTGLSLRYFVYTTFLRPGDVHAALSRFDSYLTTLFATVLGGATFYILITTRQYAQPLGRLIQKARELRRFDAPVEEEIVDIEELREEPGEWHDLERALNRIHTELRTQAKALTREREELSTLMEAMSDAILAVDHEGQALFFNSPFALLFNLGESQGHHRASPQQLGLAEMFRVPEILEGYREVIQSGEMRTVRATILTRDEMQPRHFSISIAPLKNWGGESRLSEANDDDIGFPVEPSEQVPGLGSVSFNEVHGAIGIFHDVTELKQSEQIRIEFVGNASHELRTPLTSVKGYVETLRDDIKENRFESASHYLDVIARNVDRLNTLMNDLLDLSSLESGAELNVAPFQVREVTEQTVKLLESKRLEKNHIINCQFKIEHLIADVRRVEQVLVNLVENALKYIPPGGQVDIYWEQDPKGARLRVVDNGPGIPYEHQPRLFERFYRLDSGRSRDLGGTGLGLSIVKHIMMKHGGTVRLLSHPGRGCEFICIFPQDV